MIRFSVLYWDAKKHSIFLNREPLVTQSCYLNFCTCPLSSEGNCNTIIQQIHNVFYLRQLIDWLKPTSVDSFLHVQKTCQKIFILSSFEDLNYFQFKYIGEPCCKSWCREWNIDNKTFLTMKPLFRCFTFNFKQKYRMQQRHILPKERSYYPRKPVMAFPPYHSTRALPGGQVYPAWVPPSNYPTGVQMWGSPCYPPWQSAESWHWKPYPTVKLTIL